ncbi:hypothetical protein KIPB_002709, partial [Kipferlia bialata]|eukprot:g2709.t1
MKVSIIGAGVLGSIFGSVLSQAGFDVTLIEIFQKRLDLLREEGVYVQMPDGSRLHTTPTVTDDASTVGVCDVVMSTIDYLSGSSDVIHSPASETLNKRPASFSFGFDPHTQGLGRGSEACGAYNKVNRLHFTAQVTYAAMGILCRQDGSTPETTDFDSSTLAKALRELFLRDYITPSTTSSHFPAAPFNATASDDPLSFVGGLGDVSMMPFGNNGPKSDIPSTPTPIPHEAVGVLFGHIISWFLCPFPLHCLFLCPFPLHCLCALAGCAASYSGPIPDTDLVICPSETAQSLAQTALGVCKEQATPVGALLPTIIHPFQGTGTERKSNRGFYQVPTLPRMTRALDSEVRLVAGACRMEDPEKRSLILLRLKMQDTLQWSNAVIQTLVAETHRAAISLLDSEGGQSAMSRKRLMEERLMGPTRHEYGHCATDAAADRLFSVISSLAPSLHQGFASDLTVQLCTCLVQALEQAEAEHSSTGQYILIHGCILCRIIGLVTRQTRSDQFRALPCTLQAFSQDQDALPVSLYALLMRFPSTIALLSLTKLYRALGVRAFSPTLQAILVSTRSALSEYMRDPKEGASRACLVQYAVLLSEIDSLRLGLGTSLLGQSSAKRDVTGSVLSAYERNTNRAYLDPLVNRVSLPRVCENVVFSEATLLHVTCPLLATVRASLLHVQSQLSTSATPGAKRRITPVPVSTQVSPTAKAAPAHQKTVEFPPTLSDVSRGSEATTVAAVSHTENGPAGATYASELDIDVWLGVSEGIEQWLSELAASKAEPLILTSLLGSTEDEPDRLGRCTADGADSAVVELLKRARNIGDLLKGPLASEWHNAVDA